MCAYILGNKAIIIFHYFIKLGSYHCKASLDSTSLLRSIMLFCFTPLQHMLLYLPLDQISFFVYLTIWIKHIKCTHFIITPQLSIKRDQIPSFYIQKTIDLFVEL